MRRTRPAKFLYLKQNNAWNRLNILFDDLVKGELRSGNSEGDFKEWLETIEAMAEINDIPMDLLMEEASETDLRERLDRDRVFKDLERFGDDDLIEEREESGMVGSYFEKQILEHLITLKSAIKGRDLGMVKQTLSDIDSAVDEIPDHINLDVKEEIHEAIFELDLVLPKKIYIGEPAQIEEPGRQLILEVSNTLAQKIARNPELLLKLSPRNFEEFIAELFDRFGYQVELTSRTRDGGRDIVAIRAEHGILSKLLIECKRFSPKNPVGLSYVRELYAVKTLEKATKAILATTSYFSRDARHLESQLIYELELKDFKAIKKWAQDYSESMKRIRLGNKKV